ncbi:hypothetical protein [Dactylosporangium sp. CS-033363]|uniref:hypothetical protein n=1 Tax=Dactylosporangium sp. CS-033363 TaxID=3239935 RepID=UPI003D93DC1F
MTAAADHREQADPLWYRYLRESRHDDSIDALRYALSALSRPPRPAPAPVPVPRWRTALQALVGGPRRARAVLQLLVATWWQALAVAMAVLTFGQAAGMLTGGDAFYRSPAYHLLRMVPGGMRTYGALLLALAVAAAIGYGQTRAGSGRLLRVTLSLIAGWYVLWLLALAGTWAVDLVVYSWNGLLLNGLAAFVAVLVAAAVPPDRG